MSNISVPKELLVNIYSYDKNEVEAFIKLCGKVIVKPLDASHGHGITVNVDSINLFEEALSETKRHTSRRNVVVQEQLSGVDLRVVCINYKFTDAISRLPASVVGDGTHSVKDLIEITNSSDQRGENYKAKLNIIPIDQVMRYMKEEELSKIPNKGEEVQVIGISNIGMGGVRLNIADKLPEFIKKMAEEVVKIINLPVCGVDFIVNYLPEANSTVEELQPKVIEVNECPMLTMYDDLNSKEQNKVIDLFLDYIAGSEALTDVKIETGY
jgi:cyanophycin synthetase